MKVIGLTGQSGAGKTTLCKRFEELGIPCIDTDAIYHGLVSHESPCLAELKEKFGDAVINGDGSLNRKALALLVFSGENAKENLESLNNTTHKYIWEEVNKRLTEYIDKGKRAAVIDAPALFSSKIFVGACDIIISVIGDKQTRLDRIMKRDGIDRERALARIEAQPDDSFFTENSDYYITNSGSVADMNEKLESILIQEELI
ncbi:MAG: dephospho-CoA kinase [Eubacteriales bacterium]